MPQGLTPRTTEKRLRKLEALFTQFSVDIMRLQRRIEQGPQVWAGRSAQGELALSTGTNTVTTTPP